MPTNLRETATDGGKRFCKVMMSHWNRLTMALSRVVGGMTIVVLSASCTAGFYGKQADRDVYRILKQVEADIFGEAKEFSIDTPYSGKDPAEVAAKDILDERSPTGKLVLPIEEALDYAVAHSRQFQSEKEALYLTALSLTGERHRFWPQFFADSRATRSRLEAGEKPGSVATTMGVTQALLTGANVGLSLANDLLRYYTGDPRRSAASVISLDLFQPLLRGAGWKIAGERLKQSHRNVFYAVRDYSHFQNTFAVDVVMEYFRLLQAKDVIYNQYNNYLSRVESTRYLRARSVDRQSLEEVTRAEQDELTAKNEYLISITRFRNLLDGYKITLGMPPTIDLRLDGEEMNKLRETGLIPLGLGRADGFRIALKHRLPLLNEVDRYEDNKRQIALASDRLKADLNIFGDASLANDEGPVQYEKFDFNKVRSSVGVQLNLPLDRLRERNEYRAVLVNFESGIRRLGLTLDELRNLITRGLRELERLRQSYGIQKNAVTLAENRVMGNRLRLEAGNLRFQELSDSQDDLILAQNNAVGALVDYLDARLGLLVNLGVLSTDREAFWLDADAVKIDLDQWRSARGETGDAPLQPNGDGLPTPDEIFAN